jgi:hypothetical protein
MAIVHEAVPRLHTRLFKRLAIRSMLRHIDVSFFPIVCILNDALSQKEKKGEKKEGGMMHFRIET